MPGVLLMYNPTIQSFNPVITRHEQYFFKNL